MEEQLLVSNKITAALQSMLQNIKPGLVVVRAHRNRAGAGVILRDDGLVLTNDHVLGKHAPFVLLEDDRQLDARVLARSADIDLALLQIPAYSLPIIELAKEPPRIGELVFAVGHPWGQRDTVTKGIVSALVAAQTRKGKVLTLIRTDAPLAPGNSGGPLLNVRGQMVGVNTLIVGGDQSVAIPAEAIEQFVADVLGDRHDRDERRQQVKEVMA
jgi:serine protease Do